MDTEVRVGGVVTSTKHGLGGRLAGDASAQGAEGGRAVVAIDRLLVVGSWIDPDGGDQEQPADIPGGNHLRSESIRDSASHACLRGAPSEVFMALSGQRRLVHKEGWWLHRDIRLDHDNEWDMPGARGRQTGRPRRLEGPAAAAKGGVQVGCIVAGSDEGFTDLGHPAVANRVRLHSENRTLGFREPPESR